MTVTSIITPPLGTVAAPGANDADAKLRAAAQKLESTFLAEMLKSAGLGARKDSFGGGIGEDQFTSYLRNAQADEMAKTGGIGLAETLFEAMKRQTDGQ